MGAAALRGTGETEVGGFLRGWAESGRREEAPSRLWKK